MVHLLLIVIYISFISLGLPDGLLGSAWPNMYPEFNVPVSYAGIVSMIISGGTIVSSLFSEKVVSRLGTGMVTAVSVLMTACALFGFSASSEFWQLCVWGLPYGLGAGSVDAALNNFVALHYKSRHMSWLHCFWGIGCSMGPYIMSYFLTRGAGWNGGYFTIFVIQIILTAFLFVSLPLWKRKSAEIKGVSDDKTERVGIRKALSIKGVKEVMLTFLCYCAIEQTVGLWSVSYIVFEKGVSAGKAAGWGAIFFIGITAGRFLSGFITEKLNDTQMTRMGILIILAGTIVLLLPFGNIGAVVGLALTGLGCAPVYPCLIHSTPDRFGTKNSQAVIGIQMASAYVGTTFVPPIFGLIAENITIAIFPYFLLVLLVFMMFIFEHLNKNTPDNRINAE